MLPPSPTIVQVIEAVNRNNSQIHSFMTNQAMLSSPGQPSLRASLAFERPWRLRLRARDGLYRPGTRLGQQRRTVLVLASPRSTAGQFTYCRHDQFAACPARSMLPIEPEWLMEALGTAELDPGCPYQGPFALPGDRLEIRSMRETPDGPTTEDHDPRRRSGLDPGAADLRRPRPAAASSIASGHRRDPSSGLVMPTSVRIDVPLAQFSMRLDLGNVQINQLAANPAELWSMPSYPGYPAVDLCTLRPMPAANPPVRAMAAAGAVRLLRPPPAPPRLGDACLLMIHALRL